MRLQLKTAETPFIVSRDDTIESAMAAIEMNRHRSVIVLDARGIVIGTLSDGDVRKAVLDRRLLSTPVHDVMNPNFIALTATQRPQAKQLFEQRHIFLIPVIDGRGQLLDILKAYE